MSIWLTVLLTTILVSELTRYYILQDNLEIATEKKVMDKAAFVLLTIALCLFAGMRSGIGDTGYYMYNFQEYKKLSLLAAWNLKEPGFKIWTILVGKITNNPQIFLLICSFVTIGMVLSTINRYSQNVQMSLYLFITAGMLVSTMNGLRQYLVIAVLFFSYKLVLEKKVLYYVLLCILLSTIHTSVLLMIPVFFYVQSKPWSRRKILLLVLVLILIAFRGEFLLQILSEGLSDGQYSNYSEGLVSDNSRSANVFRVMVMCVPAVLSFIERNKFDYEDKEYNVCTNMAVLTALCYCMTLRTWVFARVAMYFGVYSLLLYPMLLNKIDERNKKLVVVLFYIFYFVFFYIDTKNVVYTNYYLGINVNRIGSFTRGFYP